MKIGILQFSPELREFDKNVSRAETLLQHVQPGDLQLLVLPELAFTGYNFPNTASIRPYLEPTAAGPTAAWARKTAARLQCLITVGYPEISSEQETTTNSADIGPSTTPRFKRYNSQLTIDPSGALLAHYRKTNLYYTDATWAWPNPDGFLTLPLPLPRSRPETMQTAFAICMDFNPARFTAPWEDYELATHVGVTGARLLVASNAWLTRKTAEEMSAEPGMYDAETMGYWVERLRPLVDGMGGESGVERIVVVCNRVGVEPGVCRVVDLERGVPVGDEEEREREMGTAAERVGEPTAVRPADDVADGTGSGIGDGVFAMEARYAGSSCVMGLRGDGSIRMYGCLGRAEEKLLVVDTEGSPAAIMSLVSRADE